MADARGTGSLPVISLSAIPAVTAARMREVDRAVVQDAGVSLVQMMENAGRSLADLAIARFYPATVTVLVGAGNNGGGGLVAARHLANRGVLVSIAMTADAPPGSLLQAQLRAALACGATLLPAPPPTAGLVIDAMVGYGINGPLLGRLAVLARWARDQEAPVLALDVPSGLDATTGAADPAMVRATATLTLALPKTGLTAAPGVGELYLADISVPEHVYAELGIEVPAVFDRGQVVRLLRPAETLLPEITTADRPLAWRTPLDAVRLIASGATFASVARIALVVGTLLTVVNLGGAIVSGRTGWVTLVQAAANYAIPYVVSSLGLLSRTRLVVGSQS